MNWWPFKTREQRRLLQQIMEMRESKKRHLIIAEDFAKREKALIKLYEGLKK